MAATPPAAVEPAGPGELRRLWRLAWPVVLGGLGMVAMGTVDVAMVGAVSGDDLAAVGIGHIWSFGVLIVGLGALSGLDPIFSQGWGAGERAELGRALARTMVLATALSVPMVGLMWVAEPALAALHQPPEILPVAGAYCRAAAWGVWPAMLFQAIGRYLQGRGEMKVPMLAVFAGNLANVGGNYALVFGLTLPGGLVVPAMGAVGCGVSTSLVRWVMLAAVLWLGAEALRELPRPTWAETLSPRAQLHLVAQGGPVGIQHALEVWAFSATGLLMGSLGSVEVAAHAVAINLVSVTFMVAYGIGAAAATRVGNLIGAGLEWRRSAWIAVGVGVAWMACTASVLASVPGLLVGLFTRDVVVAAVAASLLPVAAAFQLFDGVQVVTFGVLRGAGDTRFPALINLLGYWVIGLPVAWWMGVHTDASPRWVWGGLVIGLCIVATLLLWRLRVIQKRSAPALRRGAGAND